MVRKLSSSGRRYYDNYIRIINHRYLVPAIHFALFCAQTITLCNRISELSVVSIFHAHACAVAADVRGAAGSRS